MKTDVKSCTVTGPARTKGPDAEATPQGPRANQAASLQWAAEAEPSELFAFKECQDLFRTRLTGPLLRLVAQLTGLRLHVLWHGPLDFHAPGGMPVLCPRARQRAGAKGRQPKCCEFCLQRRWKPALSSANQGRRFIGQCGITNFCACLQVDKVCSLTLVLQARVAPHAPRSTLHATTPAAFHHAVALVRLILHDLESSAQARMARSGLDNALRRLNNSQTEATRLRGELRHRLPDLPDGTGQPGLGIHAQKHVEAILDFVHQHGHRPINLNDLASAMKMNASYLSALFSQTTGVTFHQFLEEVRLSKAKELLRDPRNRVGEVARAVGYASPDSFRRTFKAHEGLSPGVWRAGQ
ncbi:MAG: helix-turn-helix transcriptional regulator [Verrucomicrobiota bacterium]